MVGKGSSETNVIGAAGIKKDDANTSSANNNN